MIELVASAGLIVLSEYFGNLVARFERVEKLGQIEGPGQAMDLECFDNFAG